MPNYVMSKAKSLRDEYSTTFIIWNVEGDIFVML